MVEGLKAQRGIALIAVLAVIFIMTILSGLVLYLGGKEIVLTRVRLKGAQTLHTAEGGAFAARAALLALMNANPPRVATVDVSLDGTILGTWHAGGDATIQNPFGILDYLLLDGQRFNPAINATLATDWVVLYVNWGLGPTRKLQFVQMGTGAPPADPLSLAVPPANALGPGSYAAAVLITRRRADHDASPSSCVGDSDGNGVPDCYIHQLGVDEYEYFYTYTVVSDGRVPPEARRRITLSRDFSVRMRRQNFAQYALFTNVHTTPSGGAIWFTSRTSFDGPVHTNGEFRFAFFPKFSDLLTSVSGLAWFNNNGSARELAANENVVRGVRRDAPVVFDSTPSIFTDDNDNPPANFTRGVAAIPIPGNPYSQMGVSIGRVPTEITPVTTLQIRRAIPELIDDSSAIPNGIYVPVLDSDTDGVSDPNEPLAGGIFVQGTLDSLTLSLGGVGNTRAVYTLVQGTQTVTITIDRSAQTTAVTNTGWPNPQTRTFAGVPKGWQGSGNAYAAIIYVEGGIRSLSGTLEEREQLTIAAAGRIDITNHIRYEDPPVVTDPNDNPLNVLGIYSANNDIRITTAAPNDLVIHAVLMAGNTGDSFNSSVNVQDYDRGSSRGFVRLLGGIIQEYYGAFGTFDPNTGNPQTGYGRDFVFDRRMSRGFSPPYFPTTSLFEMVQGADGLAGVRPVWREASP